MNIKKLIEGGNTGKKKMTISVPAETHLRKLRIQEEMAQNNLGRINWSKAFSFHLEEILSEAEKMIEDSKKI